MHDWDLQKIRRAYTQGVQFKTDLDLYETVKRNERFYLGDQWHGLKAKSIQPVVLNVLRRVVSTFQAIIVSDDIAFEIAPFVEDETRAMAGRALEKAVGTVIEKQKIKTKNRTVIRTGATTGDLCLYFSWDPDIETGQAAKGDITAEVLLGTNVIFGNPYSPDVQGQPYILLVRRRPVEMVRQQAREMGVPDWDKIESEAEDSYIGDSQDASRELATELTVFWKEKVPQYDLYGIETGHKTQVHFMRTAGQVVVQQDTATNMTLYPVAWANWLERMNCMHGVSPITEAVPTQIAINKQATNIISFTRNLAYPKIVYDARKFPKGWDSSPGTAVEIVGDPRELVTNVVGGVQMPAAVVNILEMMIRLMKDCLGASDASLGDVRPDNTPAILAAQSASNAPLELQKRTFEQFNEDCVRIMIDMICAYYGTRTVMVEQQSTDPATGMEAAETVAVTLDFGALSLGAMDVNVEVGAASYWSQTLAVTNLDKLMERQLLPDVLTYLENIPSTLLPHKKDIVRRTRERLAREAQRAAQEQAMEQAAQQNAQQNGGMQYGGFS